jgi:sulfur carrier protein
VTIQLNGRDQDVPEGGSILALLESLGVAPGRVAVEVNGGVLRREDFSGSILKPSDRVEIVQFVGGG